MEAQGPPPPPPGPPSPQAGPPPGYPPPGGGGPQNGLAIAALVCGIASIVFVFLFFPLAFILGIAAIITGVMGRNAAKRNPAMGKSGMALAGILTGIAGILLALIISVLLGVLLSNADDLADLEDFTVETTFR